MYFDVIPVKSLSFIHTIRPRLVSPAKRHHVVFLTLLQPLSPTKAQIHTICRYHYDTLTQYLTKLPAICHHSQRQ